MRGRGDDDCSLRASSRDYSSCTFGVKGYLLGARRRAGRSKFTGPTESAFERLTVDGLLVRNGVMSGSRGLTVMRACR
jgi:hypothetical protein